MNRKIATKNHVCSNCQKANIIQGMVFFHEQTQKNQFNVFCWSCGYQLSLTRIINELNKTRSNFS